MLIFSSALRSSDPVKTSFTLRSDNVSESGTCGGSCLSLFMVTEIFNGAFLVGCPASNEISVVEGGALRSVMISSSACLLKSSNFNYIEGYSWGTKLNFGMVWNLPLPFYLEVLWE